MTLRNALQATFDLYVTAYRAGDAKGCAAAYLHDARLYSPYAPPAIGRDAILTLHEEWIAEDTSGKTVTIIDAGGTGDTAWGLAAFSEGDTVPDSDGISLNIFERQPDGRWLIRMSSLNGAG